MPPETVKFEIASLHRWIVFSSPAYLGDEIENTPYQLLQICDHGSRCETLCDARGSDGVSICADESLSFSPDRLYFIVLRMIGLNLQAKAYRRTYYEIYGAREQGLVTFQTGRGKQASAENILGWLPQHPHLLEVSAGWKQKTTAQLVETAGRPGQINTLPIGDVANVWKTP